MELENGSIGRRIAKRRKDLGLRQNELAELVGISNNYLSSLERGKETPSVDILVKICNALKVTPDYLLLGSMHSNNVQQNIMDSLRLCEDRDLIIFQEIVELFVERNGTRFNERNYV